MNLIRLIGPDDDLPVPRMPAKACFSKRDGVGTTLSRRRKTLGEFGDVTHRPGAARSLVRRTSYGISQGSRMLPRLTWL